MTKNHNYYVYISTNPRRTVLYVGVTNDLDRRMSEHAADNAEYKKTFAGKFFCYNLIYYEYYDNIQVAIAREKQIKRWSRIKKEMLIARFNPQWRFLNDPVEIEKGDLPVWYVGFEPLD
jgi:putative endonuclease